MTRTARGTLAGLLLAGTAGIGWWCWQQEQPQTFTVPATSPPIRVGTETFPEPSQAEEYREVASAGHTRAVQVLEDAVRQAEGQVPVDEAALKQLRAELAARKQRLAELRLVTAPPD